jgi:hypothetical protein
MRFSNGVPTGSLVFNPSTVASYILSGFGTTSAYNGGTTSLNYAGTYKYHVTAGFNVIGLPTLPNDTTLVYDVKIGNRIICTSTGIAKIFAEFSGGEIDISGTIDMLENAGTEATSVYVTMSVSHRSGIYTYSKTWTNYWTDVDTTTNSHYQLVVSGVVDSGSPFNTSIIRHIGTLECIHSNVTPTN